MTLILATLLWYCRYTSLPCKMQVVELGSTNCWIGPLLRSRPPESSRVTAQVGLGLGVGLVSPIQLIQQLVLPVKLAVCEWCQRLPLAFALEEDILSTCCHKKDVMW